MPLADHALQPIAETPGVHTYPSGAALQQGHWPKLDRLARLADALEQFLEDVGLDKGPWVAVGFGSGIALWFALANRWQWMAVIATGLGCALAALVLLRADGRFARIRMCVAVMGLVLASGCACIWSKSAVVGTPAIAHMMAPQLNGLVTDRYDQPAEGRIHLTLATRDPSTGKPIRVRIVMPENADVPGLQYGAIVHVRARLSPPAPPRLPGSYDFARGAWFDGVSATGSAMGRVTVLHPPTSPAWLAWAQAALSAHVRKQLSGSAGAIAAAFASGDRGGISRSDDQAMRDAGLTHLLSVSGLHVSAVIGGTYFLAIRLLALWPALALRVRLPVVASALGGVMGVIYTLLTGAQVPTVRSVLGALLILAALALGRQPLSARLLSIVALYVMMLWPDAVVGPSFQMSFGSVLAIIAVADCAPAKAFLAPREEGWWWRVWRHLFMILLTGMVIDLALMPIALYHFHRAGIYGSMANVIAIPLTTFISMPMIGLGLALDLVGLGAPAWWVCGKSLEALIALAHFTAARPDAVTVMPAMGTTSFVCFVFSMLWLALWHGRLRLWGLVPAALAVSSLALVRPPDVLITGDARNIGIAAEDGRTLLLLREGPKRGGSTFTRDSMLEAAGMAGDVRPLIDWRGALCNKDFCLLTVPRGGRNWRILVARGGGVPAPRELARTCASVDIMIVREKVWGHCRPTFLLADKALLYRSGGLALDLVNRRVTTVAEGQGTHPWWRAPTRMSRTAQEDAQAEAMEPNDLQSTADAYTSSTRSSSTYRH